MRKNNTDAVGSGNRLTRIQLWARAFMWICPVALVVPNIILCFTEDWGWLSKCASVALPLGIYLLLASQWKNVGRTSLFFIPAMFYGAFQIVLIFLYGGSIIAVDMFLNVATTNVGEATELLASLAPAIVVVCVLYVPVIVAAIILAVKGILLPRSSRRLAHMASLGLTACGVVLVAVCIARTPGYSPVAEIFPANVVRNTVYAFQRVDRTEKYHQTSADFSYRAKSMRPDSLREVYVMVVGETSRAANWQLAGYGRPTNPRLSERDGLVFFPKAVSESNTTHKSVPLMLSWLTAKNFGDSIYYAKSVVSAFNDAGFSTAYYSNQGRNHSFIDFFAEEADVTEFLSDDGTHHYDSALLDKLRHQLDTHRDGKLFVVLHTYGSHFNYADRYDGAAAKFVPFANSMAKASNRAELINSYDNSIVATDALLDDIVGMLDSLDCASAMLYTSDHGEDIFDDSRGRFLHASPVPTYWQLHVPFLAWMSPELQSDSPTLSAALSRNSDMNVSSSSVVFDTLLQLAGIDSPYADKSKSVASMAFRPRERMYVDDLNEARTLIHCGLKDADFQMFDKMNILVK